MIPKSSGYPVDGSLERGTQGKAQCFVGGILHAAAWPAGFTGSVRQLEVSVYSLKRHKVKNETVQHSLNSPADSLNIIWYQGKQWVIDTLEVEHARDVFIRQCHFLVNTSKPHIYWILAAVYNFDSISCFLLVFTSTKQHHLSQHSWARWLKWLDWDRTPNWAP